MERKNLIGAAAAALMLPPAGLGGWHFVSTQADKNPGPWQFLRDAGYRELASPSRLYPPGTIITVETLSNRSVQLHFACTTKNEVLAPYWQASLTVDRHFASNVKKAFDAVAKTLSTAAAQATGNRIKQVDVSLQNMQIITMSQEDLLKIRGSYLKGTCEEVVMGNMRAGASVCQTAEVLQADLAYRMFFADALETSERAELTKQVIASLNLGADTSGVDEVRGDDLYFGVSLKCFKFEDRKVASST